MPFDVRDFPGAPPEDRAAGRQNRRLVALWLFAVAGMVAVMVILGGVTRLTGSGLSIMEWAPLGGALPPLSEAEWQRLYHLYQQIPQYKLVNEGFGLAGFKQIFWLEWVHRLWGRLIGVAFLGPLIWLWATNRLEPRLRPFLALLFVLGGLQGLVGWLMVASGFQPEATSVSPYRLVVHLIFALLLYAALLWTALTVLQPVPLRQTPLRALRTLAAACVVVVTLTIAAGGLVAGTHAGFDYNTFPLMDGYLVPADYARLSPFLRNLTENIAAVQFDHRLLATIAVCLTAALLLYGLWRPVARQIRLALFALAAAVAVQYALGVATLLLVVPIGLAAAHQAVAVLVLTAALILLHAVRPIPASSGGAGRHHG